MSIEVSQVFIMKRAADKILRSFSEYLFLLEILVSMQETRITCAQDDSNELGIHLQLQWEVDEATTVHKVH